MNRIDLGEDFANVARFLQLVVTMPRGREHTMVPCEDLRAVARELQRLYAIVASLPDDVAPPVASPSSGDNR